MNGDLQPSLYLRIGLFEVEEDGDIEPIVGTASDLYYALDTSDNIMPKAA